MAVRFAKLITTQEKMTARFDQSEYFEFSLLNSLLNSPDCSKFQDEEMTHPPSG